MESVLIVLAVGLGMVALERCRPGRQFPTVSGWLPRAILLTAIQGLIAVVATATWNRWLRALPLWHFTSHELFADAVIGYVVLTFAYYWWHRARHESAFLWRWLHQVHHSATRIEVLTSFYKHPLEIAANAVLSSFILYVGLGLGAAAAGLAVTLTGLGELFYHWNVRTPRWLGFIFQRPESHCVHHQRGHHTQNFSDLPLWDMLFGTFHNPREGPAECGLGREVERRFPEMLLGRRIGPRRRSS